MKVPVETGTGRVSWNCVAPPLVTGPLKGTRSASAGTRKVACIAPRPALISRRDSAARADIPATSLAGATKLLWRSAPDVSIAAAPSTDVKWVTDRLPSLAAAAPTSFETPAPTTVPPTAAAAFRGTKVASSRSIAGASCDSCSKTSPQAGGHLDNPNGSEKLTGSPPAYPYWLTPPASPIGSRCVEGPESAPLQLQATRHAPSLRRICRGHAKSGRRRVPCFWCHNSDPLLRRRA